LCRRGESVELFDCQIPEGKRYFNGYLSACISGILSGNIAPYQEEMRCFMEINRHAPLFTHKEILIEASPEAVWRIQADIDAWKEWQPNISKSRLDGALAPGSVFRWTSGGFAVTSTLQEVVPQQCIAWIGEALGTQARHIWTFTSQSGGTLVTTEESMQGWLITILKPVMPNFLDKSLDVWVKALKNRAEGKDENR
jgi:uncharacterized protein YndB with AHSA1/START domain